MGVGQKVWGGRCPREDLPGVASQSFIRRAFAGSSSEGSCNLRGQTRAIADKFRKFSADLQLYSRCNSAYEGALKTAIFPANRLCSTSLVSSAEIVSHVGPSLEDRDRSPAAVHARQIMSLHCP